MGKKSIHANFYNEAIKQIGTRFYISGYQFDQEWHEVGPSARFHVPALHICVRSTASFGHAYGHHNVGSHKQATRTITIQG